MGHCSLCGRSLDNDADPLSVDCGGDCWGCVGAAEAEAGYELSIIAVNSEIEKGLRFPDGSPLPPGN